MDVIIIGSGPAACAAAATCSQAGYDVLIVTAESEPKASAESSFGILESIHPGVSSLLEKIGAGGAEHSATRALYEGIYHNKNYLPLGEDSHGVWRGMHIDRAIFDAEIISRIRKPGIQFQFHEKVQDFIFEHDRIVGIKTDSGELFAKYIIDASGKNGIAGKKLNFKRRITP